MVDDERRVRGVCTTGDFTRLVDRRDDFLSVPVGEVARPDPKLARADELGSAAAYRMEQHGIMAMPVVDDGRTVVGVVHLHDLMRAGVA